MLIFYNTMPEEAAFAGLSPEAIQAEIAKWNTWIGGIAAQEKFILTEGLLPTGKTVSGKAQIITDGPFAEAKEIVGGFTLLHATNLDEAVELSKGCPIFEAGGRVEVRPVQAYD